MAGQAVICKIGSRYDKIIECRCHPFKEGELRIAMTGDKQKWGANAPH
jgi:hypothetical protein